MYGYGDYSFSKKPPILSVGQKGTALTKEVHYGSTIWGDDAEYQPLA